MAMDVDQAFFVWKQGEPSQQDASEGAPISQMLQHGSISFGKFQFESLSWEKWSVFTHDRRQEELEKFNGLVAEKKAYFEEYYKRMRALRALQQQQNQQTELMLDYSGDGSTSSLAGEDDTNYLAAGNSITASVQETATAVTTEPDVSCSDGSNHRASEQKISDTGPSLSELDETKKQEEISNDCNSHAAKGGNNSLSNPDQKGTLNRRAPPGEVVRNAPTCLKGSQKLPVSMKLTQTISKVPKKLMETRTTSKELKSSVRTNEGSKEKSKHYSSLLLQKRSIKKTIDTLKSNNGQQIETSRAKISKKPALEPRSVTPCAPSTARRERAAGLRESALKMPAKIPYRAPPVPPRLPRSIQVAPEKKILVASTESNKKPQRMERAKASFTSIRSSSRLNTTHHLDPQRSSSLNLPPRTSLSQTAASSVQNTVHSLTPNRVKEASSFLQSKASSRSNAPPATNSDLCHAEGAKTRPSKSTTSQTGSQPRPAFISRPSSSQSLRRPRGDPSPWR